jgi:hypothetical protein
MAGLGVNRLGREGDDARGVVQSAQVRRKLQHPRQFIGPKADHHHVIVQVVHECLRVRQPLGAIHLTPSEGQVVAE